MKYISTGFTELDRIFGGIKTGELVVFAGRPGMGKSMILANIFANNVIESKAKNFSVSCVYFSFEHNIGQVWNSTASRICKFDFEQNTLNSDEMYSEEKAINANEILDKLQKENKIGFYENDGPDATLFYIALNAAERKYKYGLDIVFIDSFDMLALYDGSGKCIIADRLKELAEKLNIAVIVSTSIKRHSIKRGDSLEDINLQLMRVADKIVYIKRIDVTSTYEDIVTYKIERGDTQLRVMKNIGGIFAHANVKFCYEDGGFFNKPINDDY